MSLIWGKHGWEKFPKRKEDSTVHDDFTEGEQLLTKGELARALRTLGYTSVLHADRIMEAVWTNRALNDRPPPVREPALPFNAHDRVRIKDTNKTGYVEHASVNFSQVNFQEGTATMPSAMLEKVSPSREVQVGDTWQLPDGTEYAARESRAERSQVWLTALDRWQEPQSYTPQGYSEFFSRSPKLVRRRGHATHGEDLHRLVYGK